MLKNNNKTNLQPSQQTITNPRNYRKQEIDVEELVRWTYQDQRADVIINQLEELGYNSKMVCSTANVIGLLEVGCAIDNSSQTTLALHPDAEAVHDAVRTLGEEEMGLVVHHAKTSTRPDLMSADEINELIEEDPIGCENLIHFERKMYMTWWDALSSLSKLEGMKDYVICGPAVDRRPWDEKSSCV